MFRYLYKGSDYSSKPFRHHAFCFPCALPKAPGTGSGRFPWVSPLSQVSICLNCRKSASYFYLPMHFIIVGRLCSSKLLRLLFLSSTVDCFFKKHAYNLISIFIQGSGKHYIIQQSCFEEDPANTIRRKRRVGITTLQNRFPKKRKYPKSSLLATSTTCKSYMEVHIKSRSHSVTKNKGCLKAWVSR